MFNLFCSDPWILMSSEKTDGNHTWFWYVIQNMCVFHRCFHKVSKLMHTTKLAIFYWVLETIFTPNVQFVFSFLNFTGNVSLFGPSVSVIHPDFLWCLANEFFKLFVNRTNLQKCSSGSKTLKILTD